MAVYVTAHSGCEKTEPNSEAHIRKALELGTDAVEIDVRYDRISGLYLFHERPSEEELARSVRLEEAFSLVSKNPVMKINCDLKEDGLELMVLDLARRHDLADRIIFSGSVDSMLRRKSPGIARAVEVYLNVEQLLPGIYEELKAGRKADAGLTEEIVSEFAKTGFDVLNVNYRLCTEEFLETCLDRRIGLSVWTVDEGAVIDRLLAAGAVVNITSRRPSAVLKRIRQDY